MKIGQKVWFSIGCRERCGKPEAFVLAEGWVVSFDEDTVCVGAFCNAGATPDALNFTDLADAGQGVAWVQADDVYETEAAAKASDD